MKKHIPVLLLLVICLVGCGSDESTTNNLSGRDDTLLRPDSEVRGAKIYLYNKGEVTAEIQSERIIKFEAKDSTMAYKLDIDILDSTGNVTTEVVGDSGIIYENKGLLNIYGNVVVVTRENTKLETDYLWWNSNTNKIKTDAFVRIIKGDDIVTGWGLEADNMLTRIKILNQVSGSLTDPQKLEKDK